MTKNKKKFYNHKKKPEILSSTCCFFLSLFFVIVNLKVGREKGSNYIINITSLLFSFIMFFFFFSILCDLPVTKNKKKMFSSKQKFTSCKFFSSPGYILFITIDLQERSKKALKFLIQLIVCVTLCVYVHVRV